MNNKKYYFVCRLPERPIYIKEHNTREAALAEKEVLQQMYSSSSIDQYSGVIEDVKYTVDDLFVQLLLSNPIDDPTKLRERAQKAFNLMSSK